MRIKRVLAALLTAPLVGLSLGAMPTTSTTAQAAPNPALHVDSVTLNKASVAVSGLNTVPVTATVKGAYNSTSDPDITLYVVLERTAGTGTKVLMVSTNLPLTAGTLADGTWSGPLNVPSTANGAFKVTGVSAGKYAPGTGDLFDPTPVANGPSITVTGTHLPKITAEVIPAVVPFTKDPFRIRWTVTDSSTGKPYGTRLKLILETDDFCIKYIGPYETDLSDANGVVTKLYGSSVANMSQCLMLPGDPGANGALTIFAPRPGIVAATPSKPSAPVGSLVPVNGSVAGAPWLCPVNLQRLYGATQWRTVGTSTVRTSGRFTLTAQPAYVGQIPYRVSLPACKNYRAGVSSTFYVRGL
ncbi:hypothetical protein AB0L70_03390 [Kribbella sp. NPDC051952]|uniref:hypothetical protein n=1 Tax=Kribbella sp. NPDC051952 TaxID=3154851 RepID=UPI0034139403